MPVTPNSLITTQGYGFAHAICTVAKTTYTDVTGAVQMTLPNTNGAIVKKLTAFARGTITAATQCTVWVTKSADTVNANPIPVRSAVLAAHTPAGGTALGSIDLVADNLRLDAGDKLWGSIGVAYPVAIFAEYEPL